MSVDLSGMSICAGVLLVGDEVDELLDCVDQGCFNVCVAGDGFQRCRPERSGISVEAKPFEDTFLPRLFRGDIGPHIDPDHSRTYGRPDVDVWVAANKNVGVANSPGDSLFL